MCCIPVISLWCFFPQTLGTTPNWGILTWLRRNWRDCWVITLIKVICIGRQFGSGGREIGLGLAKKLGIRFYDKEILKKAAEESGIVEELFEKADDFGA